MMNERMLAGPLPAILAGALPASMPVSRVPAALLPCYFLISSLPWLKLARCELEAKLCRGTRAVMRHVLT